MDTIRNYLDTMFAGMPNTASVLRARDELWQMMEDKYNELIAEGKTENEAVGTVIAEFGNLSELADELGLVEEVDEMIKEEIEKPRRLVTMDETESYLHAKSDSALKIGLGVSFLIASICFPIIGDAFLGKFADLFGLLGMFLMIALGVVMIVMGNDSLKDYGYMKKELCSLGADTTKYVYGEKSRVKKNTSLQRTIGILCCALCWVPAMLVEELNVQVEDLGGVALFLMVAVGVFLLVYSALTEEGYKILLNLNDNDTVLANYKPEYEKRETYASPVAATLMSVFWPTIVCSYLMVSFTTFRWELTWILFPVAVVIYMVLRNVLRKVEEN